MSALAMMLSAALLAGNAPGGVSSETSERLLFDSGRGDWEGTWQVKGGPLRKVEIGQHMMLDLSESPPVAYPFGGIDEGRGRLEVRVCSKSHPGIYRQEGDRVIICYPEKGDRRPTSFGATADQSVLILHRIKPDK